MRTPQQIISELKNSIHCSQPNIRFIELMSLANELEYVINTEASKNEIIETPVVVETPVVEVVAEEVVVEEITIEDVIEEFTIEDISEKVTTKKTKSKK
jgi:hypothetical protein